MHVSEIMTGILSATDHDFYIVTEEEKNKDCC